MESAYLWEINGTSYIGLSCQPSRDLRALETHLGIRATRALTVNATAGIRAFIQRASRRKEKWAYIPQQFDNAKRNLLNHVAD